MDDFCKQIIVEVTSSDKIVSCLELCEITSDVDVITIDDRMIDRIERYTRECALLMRADQQIRYIDERFCEDVSRFLISPGLRIRLLRAVKVIADKYERRPALFNHCLTATATNDDDPSMKVLNIMSPSMMTSMDSGNQFLDSSLGCNVLHSSKDIQLSSVDKQMCLEAWSRSIVNRSSKIFVGASLEPKVDFDMDMETMMTHGDHDQHGSPSIKRTGIFHCHICRATRGSSATVRFSISKLNYVIFSNIMTHLRLHFRRRKNFDNSSLPKYSKLRLNDNDGLIMKETLLS